VPETHALKQRLADGERLDETLDGEERIGTVSAHNRISSWKGQAVQWSGAASMGVMETS
jgi:hypothetical protein